MAQLKDLDLPNPEDTSRLRQVLGEHSTQRGIPVASSECWDASNDGDFAIPRNAVHKGGRVNVWVRFIMRLFEWELWGKKKVGATLHILNQLSRILGVILS